MTGDPRRHEARMLAVQALCVFDSIGDSFWPHLETFLSDAQVQADLGLADALPPEYVVFARFLAEGAQRFRPQADELLGAASAAWSVQRMTPVDRSILRLGVFELINRRDITPAVAINEAIEMAHAFGGPSSAAFINGVLDGVRKRVISAGISEPRP
ncbi:hypothetical protein RAS1_44160 [Phycisphaerae bacterium RAS1]|nr:hypothetical protein RAS1_44160 [Phycisphaerae bacterium RAS1]